MNPSHGGDEKQRPVIDQSIPDNPFAQTNPYPSSPHLYPSLSSQNLGPNLFPHHGDASGNQSPSAPPQATEEVLIRVPGAILNLIDKSYSVELACGDFTIVRIIQGDNIVAVLANVGDEIQWPLTKNEVAAKVDGSHYFFSIHPPKEEGHGSGSDSDDDILNYGLTIASKGQENVLLVLDQVLRDYSCFTEQRMSEKAKEKGEEVLGSSVVAQTSPEELKGERKDVVEGQCAAYWTTLAPNVEDYSHNTAKMIASGSGKLIRGILWCGDVTVERLRKGNEVMKNRLSRAEKEKDVSPETLRRIKRVKRVTQMTEKVATGVLSGVVKVSGFITGSVANSKAGKKLFGLLPGEIVLASLDGFSKICDAVEVAGKNVMSTSSTVTTELVNHRYGTKAAEATNEGLDAAGHAFGTAWVAFKIRKALNPKSVLKPTTLAKSAVSDLKAKKG
ncbi:PREDICTED: senescence/dehydration-associated protein At3g51250-like isoform X2 [Camelina sativa]|uniref:Senescence/dehydration-associated protein At3g51250-like isoform X1 n=1 Tax=Camelina sativa TaxID=90675 RepID=A0ABM0ZGT2_CAMSA|nr:PREDICTED: senescence/dehydration-associated protein At3g51250-like isoform X1 [Camelina sativa]XP_010515522.1 PREDICTED: senescence/dehydration-associated protein At3g51250-like isoform X2 [Camelina sativa]